MPSDSPTVVGSLREVVMGIAPITFGFLILIVFMKPKKLEGDVENRS